MKCSRCQHDNPAGTKFCGQCAAPLRGAVASKFAVPDSYTPYREALALAGELGMRPLVAHCHFGLGKFIGRIGKREQARQHLSTATTMYRDMDMRFWLEQAERELRGA